jgi:energy-converting hydrogenase B subunit D
MSAVDPVLMAAFDALLGVGLLLAALGALWSRSLFRAVVLFVVFGLLVAIAWIRLQAPDVALAEAAIGAGLTGALLLDAIGHLRSMRQEDAR